MIATLCIVWLTYLASDILISNHRSHNVTCSIEHAPRCCNADSVIRSQNAINLQDDSVGISAKNLDEHRDLSTETNISKSPNNLLDSIVFNLTLAVNSINNVLTSGSIFIAILTLFIALVGIFAYHDLKNDIKEKLDEKETEIQETISDEITKIDSFITDTNNLISTERNSRIQLETTLNSQCIEIEKKIDECCERAHQKMQILENTQFKQDLYFKKSIEYLYTISSILLENDENNSLRDSLYHDLQIMLLYRYEINQDDNESSVILHQKKSALDYLKDEDNGKEEDIPDLEYVAQNDSNEDIRRKAIETIGVIKKRINK